MGKVKMFDGFTNNTNLHTSEITQVKTRKNLQNQSTNDVFNCFLPTLVENRRRSQEFKAILQCVQTVSCY